MRRTRSLTLLALAAVAILGGCASRPFAGIFMPNPKGGSMAASDSVGRTMNQAANYSDRSAAATSDERLGH